jgi:hypothetical protein
VLAVRVEPGETFRLGVPAELFEGPYYYGSLSAGPDVYDVAADGRFPFTKQAELPGGAPPDIVIVENWFEELKRQVPVE